MPGQRSPSQQARNGKEREDNKAEMDYNHTQVGDALVPDYGNPRSIFIISLEKKLTVVGPVT